MKYLTLLILITMTLQSPAQEHGNLVERIIEVKIDEQNPNIAKRILIEKATEKVSEDLIKEIIGEQKFQRNKSLIQSKIIKNSIRYVPFSKPGEMIPVEKGFRLSMMMKVNQADLQKVLLENGLFYESDLAPILLPIYTLEDKIQGRDWGWWQDSDPKKADLAKLARNLETQLRVSFLKNNFYLIRPQALHYIELFPRKSGFFSSGSSYDLQFWQKVAQPWNVQILIQGEVNIQKSQKSESFQIVYKLSAIHALNGREIASVVRTYETDRGNQETVVERKFKESAEIIATELSGQVLDAWQKGTIGASLFRLTINGKVPLQLQDNVKEYLKNQIREIKEIKERVISSDQIIYEIDSSVTPKEISGKNQKLQLPGYVLKLENADEKDISYKIMKESAK